ncbi:MAG: 30S ribosomal protein S12 methylthiotransferase RimO [Clostridia bacterium]|nr:30S ribosomal protein S12 methylthiotransferase RimO [Clostridia bacterium]
MKNKKTLGIISLGCDKNRVDSEKLLASIQNDYVITNDIYQTQILVINSCGFLQSAQEEAISMIMEYNQLREDAKLEKIILTGCIPQRFVNDIFDDLVEVDGFLGTYDYDLFNQTVNDCYKGLRVNNVGKGQALKSTQRTVTTPLHYAYLKIADGCDNHCTYCAIPAIRGKYHSTPIEQLVEEAEGLGEISELILVAQDVTRYGIDLYGKKSLCTLIKRLSALDNIASIRLLYCYPDMIDNELIDQLINNDKLVKYLDIPLQHASDKVLKVMNRKGSGNDYLQLINTLKQRVKGIALRSTFIAGFPGETEEDFEILKQFIKNAKFFNAGFFAYSQEEGTPAARLTNQIDNKVKKDRVKQLYALQKQISKENLSQFKGKQITVICDGIDYDKQCFVGRAQFQAPEIDGVVYFTASEDEMVQQGQFYQVKITSCTAYDLKGRKI